MNNKYKIDRRSKDSFHFVKANERTLITSRFKLDKRTPPTVNIGPILKSRFCKINNILSSKRDSSAARSASTSCPSSQQQQAALKIVSKYKLKNNINPSPIKSANFIEKMAKIGQNTAFYPQNSSMNYCSRIRRAPNSRYKLVKSDLTVGRAAFSNENFNFRKLNLRRKSNDKFKKTNIGSSSRKLCPYFIRSGKCKLGRHCPLYHDMSTVMICPKFLKNQSCDPAKCCLSHEYSKDKMPLCHFFLKGACGRLNCPYLHVKHKKDASVCLKFKAGYCPNGAKCGMLHLERCQDNKLIYRRKSVSSKPRSSEMQKRVAASRRLSRKIENTNYPADAIRDGRNSEGCLLPSFIKLPDNPLKQTSVSTNHETTLILPSFLKF